MTTLHERSLQNDTGIDRRLHRRHDLEQQGFPVQRWDGARREGHVIGKIVDLSAGGLRIRTDAANIKPDSQIRLRMELPDFAGISPFVDGEGLKPKREWVGWMAVTRVIKVGDHVDVAGRLVDMDDMDRGMLGLYLSTHPLAA